MNTVRNKTRSDQKRDDSGPALAFSQLKSGDRGVVISLDGNPHDVARLSEIGFRRGVEFTLVRSGATSIVRINHQALCLRLAEDLEVQVLLLTS